jgi:hypothetical protein
MGVLIEGENVLIRNATVEQRFPGGMQEYAGWRRAQLCASACYISAGHTHLQTPFCARRPAIPHQQHLSPCQAF